MTTKVTIDAHAGWPVEVRAIDRYRPMAGIAHVRESVLGIIAPHTECAFYVTDSRELHITEMKRDDMPAHPRPLDFADVIRGLKAGKRYARAIWGGFGPQAPFILLVPGSKGLLVEEGRPLALAGVPVGTTFDYLPHIDMWTENGEFVPWHASQPDMLAEDWFVV